MAGSSREAWDPHHVIELVDELYGKHVGLEGGGLGSQLDDSSKGSWMMFGTQLHGLVNFFIGQELTNVSWIKNV